MGAKSDFFKDPLGFVGDTLQDGWDWAQETGQNIIDGAVGLLGLDFEFDTSQFEGTLVSKQGATSFLPVVYGTRQTGGSLVYMEVTGFSNEFLWLVYSLCESPESLGRGITSISEVYLNDKLSTDSSYSGYVSVWTRGGTGQSTTQPFPDLASASSIWGDNSLLLDSAAICVRVKWDQKNGPIKSIPKVRATVKGMKVTNISTGVKEYSENPIDIAFDYLTNPWYGKGLSADLTQTNGVYNNPDLDIPSLLKARSYCNEIVTLDDQGKTGVRYTCNTLITSGRPIKDNLASILSTCLGSVTMVDGKYSIRLEKPYTIADYNPTAEYIAIYGNKLFNFNEDNIIGAWSVTNADISKRFNNVKVTFPDAAIGYKNSTTEVYDSTYRAEDGKLLRKEISLGGITDRGRATRAAEVAMRKSRETVGCSFLAAPETIVLNAGDIVTVTHSTTGWVEKEFTVMSMKITKQSLIKFTLLEYTSSAYNLSAPRTDLSLPDTNLPDPSVVEAPKNLTATSGTNELLILDDGTILSRIKVSWNASTDAYIEDYLIEYKLSTDAVWSSAGVVSPSTDNFTYISNVLDTLTYDIRVQSRNYLGHYSSYSTLSHTVVGKTAPPENVTGVSYIASDLTYTLRWNSVSDKDLSHYEIRKGDTFATSTFYAEVKGTEIKIADGLLAAPASNIFWVVAVDTTGNKSSDPSTSFVDIVIGKAPAPSVTVNVLSSSALLEVTWNSVAGGLVTLEYLVEITKPNTTKVEFGRFNTTKAHIPIDWTDSSTISISAVDAQGNLGNTGTATAIVNVPSVSGNVSVSPDGVNINISWNSFKTSLDIDKYVIKFQSTLLGASPETEFTSATLVGETKDTSFPIPANHIVDRNYLVKAYDINGNESGVGELSALWKPLPPNTLIFSPAPEVKNGLLNLYWQDPSTDFPIVEYVVKEGDTFTTATLKQRVKGLTYQEEVDSNLATNGGKYWIAPVDTPMSYLNIQQGGLNNYGTPVQKVITITSPDAISGAAYQFIDGLLELSWGVPSSELPIDFYRVRRANASGVIISESKSTSITLSPDWVGNELFFIYAVSIAGVEGLEPTGLSVTVDAPNAPTITSPVISGDRVEFTWAYPTYTGSLPTNKYEIAYNSTNNYATSTKILVTGTDSFSRKVGWSGIRYFFVTPIDIAGNKGAPASVSQDIVPAGGFTILPQVIDNNVLLRWSEPTIGSLPIDYYVIKKSKASETIAQAVEVGTIKSLFSTSFETVSDTYKYYIYAVDTAGTSGTVNEVTATVNEPPDYILFATASDDFTGTGTNFFVNSENNINLPVNTTETYAQHFTSNTWDQPIDQINAGLPIYIEPSPANATYARSWDLGTTLTNLSVRFDITAKVIDGSIALSTTANSRWQYYISTSTDNVNWTDFPLNNQKAYADSFRYIKITIEVFTDTGDDLLEISNIRYTIDVKEKTDAGRGTASSTDTNGTLVNFNKTFSDISSIVVTPTYSTLGGGAGNATIAIYDFVDAPDPTSFYVYLFDSSGNRVSGDFTWNARGR